jgi:putative colanic acid biosynthesis UDP-glucose lipid carrier transferase
MDDHFAQLIPDLADRYLVRPGMTGLAQVSGCRGPTPTWHFMAQRVRQDRLYVQQWSLWLDVKILARTPLALIEESAF